MIPAAWVVLDALPLTTNGKVDRRALAALTAGPPNSPAALMPRNALELQLQQIWQQVLNIRAASITDNFFDLGGHSLLAVSLIDQIERQLGKHIPLAALFQNATIEQLAEYVRQEDDGSVPGPLIAIQPRGTKAPLFGIHPGDGQVLGFLELARHLGPDQPFYGLQDPSLARCADAPIAATPIEELAACYVAAIRAAQPEGPYMLLGWSFGSQVAFEMARQLSDQGDRVELLALLDTLAPSLAQACIERIDDAVLLTQIAGGIEPAAVPDFWAFCELVRQRPPHERPGYVLDRLRRANQALSEQQVQRLYRELHIHTIRHQVLQQYTPRRYSGRITLIRTPETLAEELVPLIGESAFVEPTLGWSAYSVEPVEVYSAPRPG